MQSHFVKNFCEIFHNWPVPESTFPDGKKTWRIGLDRKEKRVKLCVRHLCGGRCSSLSLGRTVNTGLLTDPATLPLLRSALDADWVMEWILVSPLACGFNFAALPFRLWGVRVWMGVSGLVMSLSGWSGVLTAAASGGCSLTKIELNTITGNYWK